MLDRASQGDDMPTPPPPNPPGEAVDVRDMLVAHQAFRREFRLAPAAVERVDDGDRRQARRVAKHLRLIIRILDHHHTGEDRLLWPRLHHRVPERLDALVTEMEHQHEELHSLLTAVSEQVTAWIARADTEARGRLTGTLKQLFRALHDHLADEEARILPLASRYLSVDEWQELERDGIGALPKTRAALAFGMLMYEGDPEVVSLMLSRAPAPARLLMPRLAPRAYARHARRIHGTSTPGPRTAAGSHETVARRVYADLWNDRRYENADDLFHPHFSSPAAPELSGGAAKLAAIRVYHAAFPDLKVTIDQLVASADQVAVRWSVTGTDTGGLRGRPPTGRVITTWGVDFLEFDNGRIIRDWVGTDWLGTLVQLGAVQSPWTNASDN
ncbi:hypothetical protein DMC64_20395 [Amycolatopsis sp. WAC 04197]|uniref:ester cyclase n=1 Tax=Amycolatopsis sp. WAC 04197 TaxID=2203199 RepID=UPI000F76697C|nr:ester cyclase [Amycolatopsis sp. WAC 04197]RSN45199.1 hypothetical protein DMC64_20395 [Amycolatopsis sp. WAC 04197]